MSKSSNSKQSHVESYEETKPQHFEVEVDDKELRAFLTIPETCKAYPKLSEILSVLRNKGIFRGVQIEILKNILSQKNKVNKVIIAEGKKPSFGDHASLTKVKKNYRERHPHFSYEDLSKYLQFDESMKINAGEVLIKKTAATPGKFGWTITGKALPGKNGHDKTFDLCPFGSEIDINNENQLIARKEGYLVYYENGARIDHFKEMSKICETEQEVDFEGTLLVHGDIDKNAIVDITGDLIVLGSIKDCELYVGGDIICVQGIQGQSVNFSTLDEINNSDMSVHIECEGNIYTPMIDSARISLTHDLCVDQTISNSNINAKVIKVGTNKTSGKIISGFYSFQKEIIVNELGGRIDTPLFIEFDNCPEDIELYYLKNDFKTVKKSIKALEEILERIQQPEGWMRKVKDDNKQLKLKKLQNTINFYIQQRTFLNQQINEYIDTHSQQQSVVCSGTAYSNVGIIHQDRVLNLDSKKENVKFIIKNNKILTVKFDDKSS